MHQPFGQWLRARLNADEEKALTLGETLFHAGQTVTRLYLLQSGEIHLARPLSHGASLTIHRALPGSLLAEASLFSSNYHCDAVVEQSAMVLSYKHSQVMPLLASEPEFFTRFCAHLAGQVQTLRTKLEICHIQSADERLLTWLRLQLATGSDVFVLDRSLKSIAAELGLAHETLYRSLKKLESNGLIDRQPGSIRVVTNPNN